MRDRRKDKKSKSMQGETLTHMLADLGFDFSPHDLRRALANAYLVKHCKMTKEQAKPLVKEVLDHAEGDTKDVTTTHYLLDSDLHSKRKTLTGWAEWVDAQHREAEMAEFSRLTDEAIQRHQIDS
jgi:polyhydroxyalkanoate synthesis regulator phasin